MARSALERVSVIRDRLDYIKEKMGFPWMNFGKVTGIADPDEEFFNIAPEGSVWDEEKGVFCKDAAVSEFLALAPSDIEFLLSIIEKAGELAEEAARRMNEIYDFVDEQLKLYEEDTYREGGRPPVNRLRTSRNFIKSMVEEGVGTLDDQEK